MERHSEERRQRGAIAIEKLIIVGLSIFFISAIVIASFFSHRRTVGNQALVRTLQWIQRDKELQLRLSGATEDSSPSPFGGSYLEQLRGARDRIEAQVLAELSSGGASRYADKLVEWQSIDIGPGGTEDVDPKLRRIYYLRPGDKARALVNGEVITVVNRNFPERKTYLLGTSVEMQNDMAFLKRQHADQIGGILRESTLGQVSLDSSALMDAIPVSDPPPGTAGIGGSAGAGAAGTGSAGTGSSGVGAAGSGSSGTGAAGTGTSGAGSTGSATGTSGAGAAGAGAAGSSGSSGTGGTSGTSGTSGTAGDAGATGNAGGVGSSGAAGTSGTMGTSGTTGAAGDAGSTGVAGGAGSSGTAGTSSASSSSSSSETSSSSSESSSSGMSSSASSSGMPKTCPAVIEAGIGTIRDFECPANILIPNPCVNYVTFTQCFGRPQMHLPPSPSNPNDCYPCSMIGRTPNHLESPPGECFIHQADGIADWTWLLSGQPDFLQATHVCPTLCAGVGMIFVNLTVTGDTCGISSPYPDGPADNVVWCLCRNNIVVVPPTRWTIEPRRPFG